MFPYWKKQMKMMMLILARDLKLFRLLRSSSRRYVFLGRLSVQAVHKPGLTPSLGCLFLSVGIPRRSRAPDSSVSVSATSRPPRPSGHTPVAFGCSVASGDASLHFWKAALGPVPEELTTHAETELLTLLTHTHTHMLVLLCKCTVTFRGPS